MNLRKRIINALFKPEMEQIRAVARDMAEDWRMIPYTVNRQQALLEMLSEMDPQLYDLMLRNLRDYQVVSGADASESYRLSVVKQSRSMYLTDPVVQFAIELWTDYAFGSRPNLTAEDPDAQAAWDEFFNADRNAPILGERKLHKLSEDELVDGELFFVVFAARLDGESTVRVIPTDQIKERVTLPGDKSITLYYRREYPGGEGMESVYYPDWHATEEQLAQAKLPEGAKLASTMNEGTDVVMLHAAFREVGGRGWPLATTGMDWEREYAGFLKDRAAVAKAAAAVVEKIKVKGGQRGIDMVRRQIGSSLPGTTNTYETNPPPAAGSYWLENEAMDREWMSRPTGASDAEKDGIPLVTQVGLSMKLFPHYLGRGDYYRLATATSMEGPTLKSFNRYQTFWSSIWRDLFKIVMTFKEQYGNASFSSLSVQVSTDRIITINSQDLQAAAGTFTDQVDRGLIGGQSAQRIGQVLLTAALETLGIQGVDAMFQQDGQAAEAGAGQRPFAEDGSDDYAASVRRAVHAFWNGAFARAEFLEDFESILDRGLRRAWFEGMRDVGLLPEDMTSEEELELGKFLLEQFDFSSGFADFIEANSKENGGKLAGLAYRTALWVNLYTKVRNMAKSMAQNDPPLTWSFGGTIEHCSDCQYANGKTYRASVWRRWGWEPQSQSLDCKGYKCQCFYSPAGPDVPLTKGHPRRPTGHQ